MFEKSNKEKTEKSSLKKRDSKKKTAKPKENDDHARKSVKVKGGATKEECDAGPVVMKIQAKKMLRLRRRLKWLCPVLTSRQLRTFRRRIGL